MRRFLRQSRLNSLAVALCALILLAAIFGEALAPHPPRKQNLARRLQPPSVAHWFGTDDFGRDIFSRVLSGARISIQVAVVVLSVAVTAGTLIGAVAGLLGGWVDAALMRLTDVFLAFPALILASAIGAALGNNLTNTMLALSVVYWPWYARLARGQVLALSQREFVQAARAVGMGAPQLLSRHMLRNILPILLVQISLDVGYVILYTSALSFLGLGAQRPEPEWGLMLNDSRKFVQTAPWTMFYPGLALTVTVLAFNLLGDGLRDYLDPRLRAARG
ncbi:MAG: ABC transporter permease [Chloroflexi bacterium]|jgi:peptide/nickel transport system permease protein|uniref:D-ala-D-ala transporter subunit n=1 Tax=Candidatus Thermofonsia Clade 3 bacterium TaxID=2364212 RepID=A0A2M8QG66_9CHLR|nr:nickel transporter permease [Candidatus Roseilinea sp. NK_OTU-006]PJF48742.1 MAG: D-ala-D-ala transporter subunit [Candidatus Thermofonsia Clade 3 bacterium]RMG62920.1 MAG: ABC transporter permease [Chloroflexota bacterium]